MPNIRIMSWNIENIGESNFSIYSNSICNLGVDKPKSLEKVKEDTINYIVSIIQHYRVHVVGIMEVRSKMGKELCQLLKDKLPGWEGVYGSQQADENRKEQYIYLWDQSAESPVAGLNTDASPSTHWLYGIVDDNLMDLFFKSLGIANTDKKRNQIYSTLVNEGYLETVLSANKDEQKKINAKAKKAKKEKANENAEWRPGIDDYMVDEKIDTSAIVGEVYPKSRVGGEGEGGENPPVEPVVPNLEYAYRLIINKWVEIQNSNYVMNLKNNLGEELLTPEQNIALKNILIKAGIIRFPEAKDRSPFLLNLNLKNGVDTIPLLLALIHSPAPDAILIHTEEQPEEKNAEGNKKSSKKDEKKFVENKYSSVYSTVNALQQCEILQNANNFLIMGDLNIGELPRGKSVSALLFDLKNEMNITYTYGILRSENWGDNPFLPLTAQTDKRFHTLAAKPLITDKQKTSLTKSEKAIDNALAANLELLPEDYLSEAFDKFFFKCKNGEINDVPDSAIVGDLIPVMNSQNPKPIYDAGVASAGMLYYKQQLTDVDFNNYKQVYDSILYRIQNKQSGEFGVITKRKRGSSSNGLSEAKGRRTELQLKQINDRQERLSKIKSIIENLDRLKNIAEDQTKTVPINNIGSFLVYRKLSDHLPIVSEFTFVNNNI
jgi:hypothetical protein